MSATFVPMKHLSINYFIFTKKHLIQSLSCIDVWFIDQNFGPLELEDRINLTLVINDRSI